MLALVMGMPPARAAEPQPDATARGATGLPLPRFVSLKSDRINLRQGPGTDYPTAWVFQRAGLPVEILKEYEGWRQIRDADGAVGWVQGVVLSGRRTAQISPWDKPSNETPATTATPPTPAMIELRNEKSATGAALALLEPGVIVSITDCDGTWCRVSASTVRGYIEQVKLWGVYPGEIVK
jgi:SH3-like domain-containing protein